MKNTAITKILCSILLCLSFISLPMVNAYGYTMTDIKNGISTTTGTAVPITLNYNVISPPASCSSTTPNCVNLFIVGFGSQTLSCLNNQTSPAFTGAFTLSVTAPSTAGTYDIWIANRTGSNMGDCSGVTYSNLTSTEKQVVGAQKLTVTAPPPPPPPTHLFDWGWGYIDNLSVNGSATSQNVNANYSVTAGANVSLTFPYLASTTSCSSLNCAWAVNIGITGGGTPYCTGNQSGLISQTTTTATVVAPTSPGTYNIWAYPNMVTVSTVTCHAHTADGGGCPSPAAPDACTTDSTYATKIGSITVPEPTPQTPGGSYVCTCKSCSYTSSTNFKCSCKNAAQSWVNTSTNPANYGYKLSNQNGQLKANDGKACSNNGGTGSYNGG